MWIFSKKHILSFVMLAMFSIVHTLATAKIITITEIQSTSSYTQTEQKQTQSLPHHFRQPHSQLRELNWQITLPPGTGQHGVPALLVPAPIQGAQLRIQGELIHEFPGSDQDTLRQWYRPILITIPKHLLATDTGTPIQVTQHGHLRGWFIAPMLAGSLQELRPLYETYTFISQTLSISINGICALAGLFLALIGWRTQNNTYRYSGYGALTWALLFSLALTPEIPTDSWHSWRLLTYGCTGLLIYTICRFMLSLFGHTIKPAGQWSLLLVTQSGWLLFALLGTDIESALDIYWTGLNVGLYIGLSAWVIGTALKQGRHRQVWPIALHWAITAFLALHDYSLQAGLLPISAPQNTRELWYTFLAQPIYLTHLALPAFVIMAMWLLANEHLLQHRQQIQHHQALAQQRQRMVSDIHDGVGARINLLIWRLRSHSPPTVNDIEADLHRCMDELRFAIHPENSGAATLGKLLQELCTRLQPACQKQGIELTHNVAAELPHGLDSNHALQAYKILQESLNNALKHSRATQIHIDLQTHPDQSLHLSLTDNGQGIPDWDNTQQKQIPSRPLSLGLKSLHNRALQMGGQLHIQSQSHGTTVTLTAPRNS